MVYPLLSQLLRRRIVERVHWVSLNSTGLENVGGFDDIGLHHITMQRERMRGYGSTKEAMWNVFHGREQETESASQLLWQDDFSDYTYYNRVTAERITDLDKVHDYDLFYIHDFQQLQLGHMLQTLKPKLFRWHIPFDESTIPHDWVEFLSTYLNSYDLVVVSCKKYLKALQRLGYTGKARYVYPYIDPSPYRSPTKTETTEFCRSFGIRRKDKVVLVVARLDPVKGQDKAIVAAAEVIKEHPHTKFVMIGNGSFSSSKQGMGLSKAERWLHRLLVLAGKLGIEDQIIFTGYQPQEIVNAAYQRCDLTLLPSIREGFGLVVIEAWLYKKPVIVSSRAGVAELIKDGRNGLLADPEDPVSLAEKIGDLLADPERSNKLGERGFASSRKCLINEGVKAESELIRDPL